MLNTNKNTMKTNSFKNNNQPAKDVISQTIGRDAKPVRRLNPPVFEEERIDFTNPNITWGMSIKKETFKFFN